MMDFDSGPLIRSEKFNDQRSEIITITLRLLNQRAGDFPPLAVVARAADINRTTAYYYFASQLELVRAVEEWALEQVIDCIPATGADDYDHAILAQLTLAHPHAFSLLMDALTSYDQLRARFPQWAKLVARMERLDSDGDGEVQAAWLLGGAINGPLILRNSLGSRSSRVEIAERIASEQSRQKLVSTLR